MEHAWLDSLSEDWVSQPRSDESIAQINPPQQSDNENQRPSNIKGRGLGSRIPRPVGAPGTNDNSINVLAERSLSYINSTAPRRDQAQNSRDLPRPQEKNRYISRSVSGGTVGSVVHNTVHQRSPSASPGKGHGATPEWKRRLVYGNLAYGEQRDLFCSAAADGLEGIFKPPPSQDVADPEDPFVEGDSNQHETTLPSSPPVFRPPPHFEESELHEDPYDSAHADISPSPSPRRSYQDIHYHLNESARSADEFSIHQDTSQLERHPAEEDPPPEEEHNNALQPPEGEVRKPSGQSVFNNEDFSPIYLSRHESGDGRLDFAPMELPVDQLRSRLERLHANQMLLDSNLDYDASNPQGDSYAGATNIDSTEEYVRNGGFLNLQRGGRSGEGSFRHRLLSPTLGNDSSEMFPDQSLQASTPKQFPTVRNGLGGPGRTIDRSPLVPRAPYPSPEKRRAVPQSSGGSPLKLFGPYDTFTNQTLMRRISQFEEQMTNSEKSFNTNPFRSSSAGTVSRPSGPSNRNVPTLGSVGRFGDGDLEGYEFSGDVSGPSVEESRLHPDVNISQQENIPPDSPEAGDSSPSNSSQLVIHRRRQGGALSSSQHNRVISGTRYTMSEIHANGLLGTPKRDSGSEGKRPRTSPSKDPTPKRRRTLHKTDIAYGLEREAVNVDTVQMTHQQMQAAMEKKRKDARPSDMQKMADPDVLAHRHILRPRTPTPSQRSSVQRETAPSYGDVSEEIQQKRSPFRNAQPSAGKQTPGSEDTHRKPSIQTQDFLDEAAQIMAMIRNQVRPTNLTSVHESDEQAYEGDHGEDDSYEEPFSRPPSRDGAPVPRVPARQEDPEILQRLMKYQEMSEMGDVITSSLRSMSLAKEAVRTTQEMERQLRESTRTNLNLVGAGEEEFSDPPNIRISQGNNTESGATTAATGTAFPSTSSGGSTNRTASSRTSECKRTIAPQSVSHLIPDQVGSMYLDRDQNRWVKKKGGPARVNESVFGSEDDPFGSIPDLTVDMTMEMRNLKTATKQEAVENPEDMPFPSSPLKTPGGQSMGFAGLSPGQDAEDAVSRARNEISKLGSKAATSPVREEEVEREISINEGRRRTPSKRRNLTISFSSPVASIIRDVLPEDLNDVSEDEDYTPELPEPSADAKGSDALPKQGAPNARRGSRGFPRQASGRVSFVPRPVSRIDEQDEESTRGQDEVHDRQVSIIGENSLVAQATPDARRTSLSFIIKRQPNPEGDSSAIIGQNVGNLSLSPLSEFTMHNPDQSYGLEVSYVMGNRHLETGDKSKKVNSIALRELVDRLTETEPEEPYWDGLTALDLQDKRLSSLHMLDEFCGGLVSLDASSNALTHLDGVPSGVRQLKVCGNMLSELTAWDHLVNLQYVDVSNNEVRSLSALRNLVHLRSIKADNNLLTSLDGIGELDGLLSLRARNNEIEELDFAGSGLQRLSELDLGGNRISEVRNLEELSSLSTLKLQRNRLETFSCARKCEALRYLDLSDNSLDALDLTHTPKLRLLHADRNNLTTLAGLAHARHLDSLSLREQRGHTPLDVGLILSTAYEVRKLFLSGNYVEAFRPQIDLLNLQLLELASCGLRELPRGMGAMMPNLRNLNICFNAVSSLEPLRFVPRLKRLLASGNRMADGTAVLGVASGFPHLRELDLRDNPMTLGFYPPGQVLVRADASAVVSVEGFRLPAADRERDARFRGRLDEGTGLRRRLYEVVVVGGCKGLRVLDGLAVRRGEALGRDEVFERLVREGVIPKGPKEMNEGETPENEEGEVAEVNTEEGEKQGGDGESTRWPAEDSFA